METLANLFQREMGFRNSPKLWLMRKGAQATSFDEIEAGYLAPILNSLSDGLVLTDEGANIKVLNKAATVMLGGRPLTQCPLFHPDRTPFDPEQTPLKRALGGEEVEQLEVLLKTPVHPDGVSVEISASPMRDQWGHIYGAVSLIRDISKRKIAEEELRHSKLRLQTLSHMVNDFVWEWDITSDIVWRQGQRKAYGYGEEQVPSADKWWREKIHPDDQERIFGLHDRLMTGAASSWRAEYRVRKNDGSYAYVIGQAHVTRWNEKGHPTYMIGASLDITERRAIEERLAQLALVVESTEDAVFSVGLDRAILSWNKGAEKLLGYTAAEAVGRDVSLLGDDPAATEAAGKFLRPRLLNGQSVQRFEMWRKNKDGERMLLSHSVSPNRNVKGEVVGFGVVARDITDLRKAEEEILLLNTNLARSNEELKQFAAVASHDISEPLSTMAGFAALLKKDYGNLVGVPGQELMDFIVESSRRMRRLIDSLLDYARVEQTPLNLKVVDCDLLIERLKTDLGYSLEKTKAELIVTDLPSVSADEVQLYQLFQNLISNALKFSRNGHPKVGLSGMEHRGEKIFAVKDNGIGIDPNDHDRMFKTFQRLNGHGEFPGSGLGLATCKRIVERHGGRIWFESFPGNGTTFYFSIPNQDVGSHKRSI